MQRKGSRSVTIMTIKAAFKLQSIKFDVYLPAFEITGIRINGADAPYGDMPSYNVSSNQATKPLAQ